MSDENMREVIGGLASLIGAEMTAALPIPLGDSSYAITQMGYLDGDPYIWLRTNADDVWIVRVQRLGMTVNFNGREDERRVVESWKRYKELVESKDHALRYAKALDIEDENLALQTFYEEVLSDDERECWDRWSPGGYATKQELEIVKKYPEA